jgi:hypothetical protein
MIRKESVDETTPQEKRESKSGLPYHLKTGIEKLSAYSMDDVRVHYNSVKPAQLQAYAYTHGTEIHVASGQEKYLPHEAWHVVQQKQKRVNPTFQMKGNVSINDSAELEREADVMGAKAMQLNTNHSGAFSDKHKEQVYHTPQAEASKQIQKTSPGDLNVVQLARWQLVSQDTWTGIDPQNLGSSKTHPSGTHPIGSIIEDTSGVVINPTSPNGHNLPSGSYGDWRKVARSDEQVDHFPPNASYKGTQYANVPYSHRPAFPIRNREGHRPAEGEEYGYGGHVSTTNSTFVQKGYTPDLNKMMKTGDFFGAMKQELIDKSNVALYQYGDRSVFNELLKPAIKLSYEYGWITQYGYFYLLSMLERFKETPNG